MVVELAPTVRDIFLIFDAIQLSIYVELGIFSLYRAYRQKNTLRVNGGWAVIFAGFGIIEFLGMLNAYFDYYVSDIGVRVLFILNALSTLAIIFLFEYFYQKYKKTKYLITTIGFGIAVLATIFYNDLMQRIVGGYYLILFGFTLAFFLKLISNSSGSLRISVILFTISFYLLMFGNFFKNEITLTNIIELGGNSITVGLSARIIKLISILIMSIVLFNLPIFLEVNWRENLLQILVIHKRVSVGIASFEFQRFSDRQNSEDRQISEELVAGGMIGITTMLKEISQSKEELKILDHGDIKILLEYGEHIIIALSVKEEMHIYREKLIELRDAIGNIFNVTLANWGGDMRVFEPLVPLINTIFNT